MSSWAFFSLADPLAARAIAGDSIPSVCVEAEMHGTASGDPKRAETLFLRIRRSREATRNDELYVSHRLIDLYIVPLDDQFARWSSCVAWRIDSLTRSTGRVR